MGSTKDLKTRLQEHGRSDVRYTSSKTPYKLVWYCAFLSKKKALDFEKYLKQGSGFAFARKRLVWNWKSSNYLDLPGVTQGLFIQRFGVLPLYYFDKLGRFK